MAVLRSLILDVQEQIYFMKEKNTDLNKDDFKN
jgi:hypothetical protein